MLAFLVFWGIAEYIFDTVQPRNVYNYKYYYVKNNPAIKTLLIGHSHFENSINPYLMGDSIFDFAISGRKWIYWDVELMKELMPAMPNLKTVIFPLGYDMLFESQHYDSYTDEFVLEYTYNYSKYMHVYYDRFPESLYYRSALLCNRMGAKYWHDYKPIDPLGYDSITGCLLNSDRREVMPMDTILEIDMLCYKEFRTYLTDLARMCYENNVRFVAVTCPCADIYKTHTCEQGIKMMYELIDSVRAEYPIEYYNYLFDEEFRADSIYFDYFHLNSIGADMFALRVKKDLGL